MKTRTVVAATVTGLAVAGAISASKRGAQRATRDFYDWRGSVEEWPTVNGIRARCPAYVNHLAIFGSFHAADPEAIERELPSDDVHPVRLPDARAIVFVGGLHYRDITNSAFAGAMAPPYGEVMVAPMVSRTAAPPIVPIAALVLPLPASWRAGMFPLFVPVTHRWSRDGGWAMGVPKFVADLDFDESVDTQEVRAAEGGRSILRLRVPLAGDVRVSHLPMLSYAASDGMLFETKCPAFAYQRVGLGGRGAELELGDHEVADRIRDLGVSTAALGTLGWVDGRLIIPARHRVGLARPYPGFRGGDRWFGRYTIRYPGTAAVDQYAYLSREGIERTLTVGGARLIDDYVTIDEDLGRPRSPDHDGTDAPRGEGVVIG